MYFLLKIVIATICWLGIFEPHLVEPLAVLPFTSVLQALTMPDYLLWMGTLLALEIVDLVVSYFNQRRHDPTPVPLSTDKRRVIKRGDWNAGRSRH